MVALKDLNLQKPKKKILVKKKTIDLEISFFKPVVGDPPGIRRYNSNFSGGFSDAILSII